MIERNFKKFLQQLANNELKENLFARVIANYYDKLRTDSKEKFYESLLPYYKTHDGFQNLPPFTISESENVPVVANKDFRISSIRIANVKGFPDRKSNLPYGFNLSLNNRQNCNAIILGANSSGKTSIFSAIEYIYGGEIGEARLRNYIDFKDYLTHFNSDFNQAYCKIDTPEGEFDLKNPVLGKEVKSIVNPQTHFIGDFDIYNNGQMNYEGEDELSFHYLIAVSLGLKDYLDFKALIGNLSNYKRLKEKNEIKKTSDQIKTLENNIEEWSEQVKLKTIEQSKLQESIDKNQPASESHSRQEAFEILNSRKSQVFTVLLEESEFRQRYNYYLEAYARLSGLLVEKASQTEIQFLSLGLELMKETDDCPFCQSSEKDIETIKKEANDRVKGAQEFFEQNKVVAQNLQEIRDSITELYHQIEKMQELLREDITELSKIAQFGEFVRHEKAFLERIENTYNPEIVQTFLSLDLTSGYNPDAQRELQKYLAEYKEYYWDSLMSIISTFQEIYEERKIKLSQVEEELLKQHPVLSLTERIAVAASEIKRFDSQIQEANKTVERLQIDRQGWEKESELLTTIKKEAGEIFKIISAKIDHIVTNTITPIKDTIESILSDYFDTKDTNLIIELKDKPVEDITTQFLIAKVMHLDRVTGELIEISPNKYFNTFRYRLFCMMVACSIAIASRRNSKVSLPLILDDVFYASDYIHRAQFVDLLKKIIFLFKKYSPDLPFQFILFTHDELIFECAMDAIGEYEQSELEIEFEHEEESLHPEWRQPLIERTIFVRLFPPTDLEEYPAGPERDKFWDLLYKLSYQIPEDLEAIVR